MALDFGAGCLGGCAGVLVGHPFDTVKVHLQTQNFRNPQYLGTIDCFRKIILRDSVAGLYKGMSSPIAGIAVVNAIIFGVYGNIQRHMSDPNGLTAHWIAGSLAGLIQSAVCSPLELAKTRIQLQTGHQAFANPLQCITHVAKTQGIRGVFKGLGLTAARDVPAFGAYFVSYELMTRSAGCSISTAHTLFAGGAAGMVSWIVCYPVDVIKSRMQIDGMSGAAKYSSSVDCIRKSVQAEGWKVLTRGLNSTMLRAFPTNAATFAVVNWCFRAFGNQTTEISLQSADVLPLQIGVIASPLYKEQSPIKKWGRGLYTWCERNLPAPIQHKKCATYKSLYFLGAFHEAVCCSEIAEITTSCCDEDEDHVLYYIASDMDATSPGRAADDESESYSR